MFDHPEDDEYDGDFGDDDEDVPRILTTIITDTAYFPSEQDPSPQPLNVAATPQKSNDNKINEIFDKMYKWKAEI